MRRLLWMCPSAPQITQTFNMLSVECHSFTAYFGKNSRLLLGIFLNLLPASISAMQYVLEETVNANSVITFSMWTVIIIIKMHENVCVGKAGRILRKEVHKHRRPGWEHKVTSVKFYLSCKNCVCVMGLLFEGVRRQVDSKSRMSGLLAGFLVILGAVCFFTFCSLKESRDLVFWC